MLGTELFRYEFDLRLLVFWVYQNIKGIFKNLRKQSFVQLFKS